MILGMELRTLALAALCLADPQEKVAAAQALAAAANGPGVIDPEASLDDPGNLPGRPPRPMLVPVQQVPRRSPHTAAPLTITPLAAPRTITRCAAHRTRGAPPSRTQ